MTSTSVKLSFEAYLTYEDGTDTCYELNKGELIVMSPVRGRHAAIAEFLNDEFRTQIKRQKQALVSKQGAIGVRIPRVSRTTSRISDVCVVTEQQ